jgi:hypothetical protein
MTPEKDAQLCEKYPKIFRDRNGSPQATCMCWGFSCADGWYDLIDTLCYKIQQHVDQKISRQKYAHARGEVKEEDLVPEEDLQVVAAQVKEKFGGLRFYVGYADEEVHGMIRMAEAMSYKLCEECGNPGKSSNDGWIRTLCAPCREEYEKKRAQRWTTGTTK